MNRPRALLGAAPALVVAFLPLTMKGPLVPVWSLPSAGLLGVLATLSVSLDRARVVTVLALAGWAGTVIGLSDQRSLSVTVICAFALRLWCAVPELVRLGPECSLDAVVDAIGGAAVAGLVILTPASARTLPPEALVLSIVAVGALLLMSVLRLRRRAPLSR